MTDTIGNMVLGRVRGLVLGIECLLLIAGAKCEAQAQAVQPGDADRGKAYFAQNCALCHADTSGPDGAVLIKQGPSLVGVFGRQAGTGAKFTYTQALVNWKLPWDKYTLDNFLRSPSTTVPGTTMPVMVSDAQNRQDLIAYLETLKLPAAPPANPTQLTSPSAAAPTAKAPDVAPASTPGSNMSDWRNAAPGVKHYITPADLPAPFKTTSVGNGPQVVGKPEGATLSVPAGFTVKEFASGLSNCRCMRVAPNGDIFVAETASNQIHIFRADDGADTPTVSQVYADGLDRPFGMAFYPPGPNPEYLYIGNTNSVVRIAYHNGDLKASGSAEVIVPELSQPNGNHTTRDVAFSPDGRRMFISVGSSSNDAEGMTKKNADEVQSWEAEHGVGAAWDFETNRADILVTDPDGRHPLEKFATGIRNPVGIAINPVTGDLWTSVNERDALGDDLVPDYITRVKEGGFYGWPWYYIGKFEDPRHAGERPDLAGQAIVPDVLLQAHSASLEMVFYPPTTGLSSFPAEYTGDAFAAEHGSWNRNVRTGYKVIRVRVRHGIPTGEYDDFLTGFVADDNGVWGRPVGVAVAHDGALLVSEDGHNTIWRVAYKGR